MGQPLQHQARPTVPLTADTNPPQVAGMAWHKPWEPPRFPTETKVYLHQTSARRPDLPEAPVGISGMAWFQGLSEPRFGPVAQGKMKFEAFLTVATLPSPPAGQPWAFAWEPPRFPMLFPTRLMQTRFYVPNVGVIAPPPSGIPYINPWEPPRFDGYPSRLQQTEMFTETPVILPPITATMWRQQFSEPYFPLCVRAQFAPQAAIVLLPGTAPVGIAGMAWRYAFDQPRQRKVDVYQMRANFQGVTSLIVQQPYWWVTIIF